MVQNEMVKTFSRFQKSKVTMYSRNKFNPWDKIFCKIMVQLT